MTQMQAITCGQVLSTTPLLCQPDLTLLWIDTTTHQLEVWWSAHRPVPSRGCKVSAAVNMEVAQFQVAGQRIVAAIARSKPLSPSSPRMAARWGAAKLMRFGARTCDELNIEPLARYLERRALAIGSEQLMGLRQKGSERTLQ